MGDRVERELREPIAAGQNASSHSRLVVSSFHRSLRSRGASGLGRCPAGHRAEDHPIDQVADEASHDR